MRGIRSIPAVLFSLISFIIFPAAYASAMLGASLAQESVNTKLSNRPVYRHAYYLFLSDKTESCEDCYVPLLITQTPIEKIANTETIENAILIITYERDSIWQIVGAIAIKRTDLQDLAARRIRVRDKGYRYQEITAAEVIELLENPSGTIPISRPVIPQTPINLSEIISDFKSRSREH
jgi:hypothetical protein